ncbi:helix-turn-helix transcriptional regulator [Chakrabartyella piscis]|uniref:helix-turn-helix domain-containing protein n=1 Tax=Chakrabartyella piscis TaxID=2918914 RepID=UPI0029586DD0|nr:helix-turn-helix transcriptional regulator [Chakrabartyella piscis]
MKNNSVITLKDYGEIEFKLKEFMDERNITRGALSRLANIRHEVATKWYFGNIEKMDLDVLARICFALDCDINDIISYKKAK